MPGYKEREHFIESVIPSTILDDAIAWIRDNMVPEDVFPDDVLHDWALENEFFRLNTNP